MKTQIFLGIGIIVAVMLSNEREISVGYLLPGTGPSGAPHKRYPTLISRPILSWQPSRSEADGQGCLKRTRGHHCCMCQQKTCRLNVEVDKVDEECFDVECEDICIPPVRFWWETGPPKRCGKVRTVRKLVVDERPKRVCTYNWEVVTICRGCYRRLHRLRCLELGLAENTATEQTGLPQPIGTTTDESGYELLAVRVARLTEKDLSRYLRAENPTDGMINNDPSAQPVELDPTERGSGGR